MTDEHYKDMVISHDKHIDTLAISIKNLTSGIGATNKKLDNVIDVITNQNVLIERINNLDTTVTESFKRACQRLDKAEHVIEEGGCLMAKNLTVKKDMLEDKQKVANNRIHDLETDLKSMSSRIGGNVAGSTVRWAIGLLVTYSILFGTYVVTTIHDTDTVVTSYISKAEERSETIANDLDDIKDTLRLCNDN